MSLVIGVIGGDTRPKLARKARLRFDRHTNQHWLLYPERGLLLSRSAAAIAQLCTGSRTVDEIVDELHAASSGASRDQIAQDVQHFLGSLKERALLDLL